MKLFKMLVCAVSLLAAGQNAHAVGQVPKSDVRDGQLACMETAIKGGRSISSNERRAVREEAGSANAVSAQ